MTRQQLTQTVTVVFLTAVAVALYWPWFTPGFIGYGDWWHNLPTRMNELYGQLLIWDGASNFGSGLTAGSGNNIITYWVGWSYGFLQSVLHIPVSVSVRLVWFIPYAFLSFFSAWYLGYVLTKRQLGGIITALIYPLSTFVLVDIQGGHMTIALAYALAPLAIGLFYQLLDGLKSKHAIWLGIILALQAVYDVRISYLTILAIGLLLIYALLFTKRTGQPQKRVFGLLGVTVLVGLLLSTYWLIHLFIKPAGALGALPAGYDNISWLSTLSYVKLTNAFAINHIWWPWSEGIQQPIQPLFYIVVVLALIGATTWRRNRYLPYFFGLFLLGVFLAKGINPPAGGVNSWLFQHVPGFSIFRDPAKFFTLVMLGVAPLAAFGTLRLIEYVRPRWRQFAVVAVVLVLLAPHYSIFFGQRHGTFVTKSLPVDYQQLENWQTAQTPWGRVLWAPLAQRYVLGLQHQPSLDYQTMTAGSWSPFVPKGVTGAATLLKHPYGRWLLQQAGVRYIGVPVDTEDEIYRHYGGQDYWQKAVDSFTQSTPVKGLGKIALYPFNGSKDEVHLAQTAVLIDNPALSLAKDLPILNDADVLVQAVEDADYTVSNVRQTVMSLKTNFSDPGVWTFYVPQKQRGSIKTDAALADRPLTIDGQPLTPTMTLDQGWHTLKLVEGSNPVVGSQPAASYRWGGCGGQENPDDQLVKNDNGTVSLRPAKSDSPGCAVLNLGMLNAGIYKVTFQGQAATGIQGLIEYIDDAGTVTSIDISNRTDSFLLSQLARRAISVRFRALSQPGAEVNNADLLALTFEQLLTSIPQTITLLQNVGAPVIDTAALSTQLRWKKPSTRQYEVSVPARSEGTYLVLSQGYSTGWRLQGINNVTHLPVNGGQNGWFLPAGAATTVLITYWYVWPYWLGFGITLVTAISLLIILRKQYRYDA